MLKSHKFWDGFIYGSPEMIILNVTTQQDDLIKKLQSQHMDTLLTERKKNDIPFLN